MIKVSLSRLQRFLRARNFLSLLVTIILLPSASLHAIDWMSFFRHGNIDEKFQSWLDEGRALRERRLFEEALLSFNRILEADPLHEEATFEIASTYYQAHRWAEAVDWFYALSAMAPQRRLSYARRWAAALYLAGRDTLLQKAARGTIRQEIADFLKSFPWDWETLQTAREGAITIADSLLTEELTRRILEVYPDTPAGYSLLSDRFYDGFYPVLNDKAEKISYLHQFLGDHRQTQFRETAWLYLLQAYKETADSAGLRQALSDWLVEDPDNPWPYERGVRYLLDFGVRPDSLLPLARAAVDRARGWRGQPLKHIEQRMMEGKNLYSGTRLNLARVLLAQGRRLEAKLWLEDGLRHSGFGPNDEGTVAPFHYFLGVIAAQEKREDEAFDAYVQAMTQGDVRGEWTARADSALRSLPQSGLGNPASDLMTQVRNRSHYFGPIFDDVTENLGLDSVNASRIAWGDANHDGYDDLLAGGSRLFINDYGRRFIEATDRCGLRAEGVTGGVWADVDLDGDLDLFCSAQGRDSSADRLYLNQYVDIEGIPHFLEVTEGAAVISDSFPTEGAAWGDLQGDGRPDLYVANYEQTGSEMALGTPHFLYLNLPDANSRCGFRFVRLGPDSGLSPPFGENLCGRGVNWGDFDSDGDQDIYVSNYRLQENFLWVNDEGKHLTDLACFYGVAGRLKEGWWGHTIGSEWGDFDNDGDLDLIAANLAHPRYIEFSDRTMLYENRLRQDGLFVDVRATWGLKYEETHSDPAWGDVDGDGDLDLYLTSIYPGRRSFLYLNNLPQRQFQDATFLSGTRVANGWGCAFSDFDNDGDLDLAVGSSEGLRLFRNRGTGNHWLEVELPAVGSAYGTRLILKQKDQTQMREIQGGKGTTAQHSRVAYFGLGASAQPVTLEIHYPSGKKLKWKKITPDQKLILSEVEK